MTESHLSEWGKVAGDGAYIDFLRRKLLSKDLNEEKEPSMPGSGGRIPSAK